MTEPDGDRDSQEPKPVEPAPAAPEPEVEAGPTPPAEPPFLEETAQRPAPRVPEEYTPEFYSPVQMRPPESWPLARPAQPLDIGPPPREPPQPAAEEPPPLERPRLVRGTGPRRSLWRRAAVFAVQAVMVFVLGSVLWVLAYRFIAPPVTITMAADWLSGRGAARVWMPLSRIDPDMPRAAIAAEDARFCSHSGFDFNAMEKAYARNATGKKKIRGGSTISQQTAKNVFLWQGGGYFRKGLEAWFTFLIEAIWGKQRIMEVYLNVAETGIGTYGVNAGSLRYFGHDASHLSPQEAARIAAVLPLPKKREAIDPGGFTRRYGNTIAARIGTVRGDGLDDCLR